VGSRQSYARCGRGLARLMAGLRSAVEGWAEAWRCQQNVRIHAGFVVAITGLGLYLGLPATQWAILVLTFIVVLAAEFLNSALEALTDLVSPEYHALAKEAKDMGAGAVLLTAVGAVIIGLLILGPPLWARVASLAGGAR